MAAGSAVEGRPATEASAARTAARSAARSAARLAAMADPQRPALRFTLAMLFCCLILQRFGLPFGGNKSFSLVGPLGIGLGLWGLLNGTLAFDRGRLLAYVVLVGLALFGVAWHALHPIGLSSVISLDSLAQFLLLTSFATLTFAEPVDERRFFRAVNRWFAVVAIAGVAQFVLQFAGLHVFAFTGIVPDALLFEFGYNSEIPTGIGDAMKSNGLFLVEPSVFSQVMALGIIIEVLSFRRARMLYLFAGALLLSFAGTGWIVLGTFVVVAGLGLGWRGLAIAAGVLVVGTVLVGAVVTVVPEAGHAFAARADEFSRPGTSGHRRFVTPFWALSDSLAAEPSAALIGLGSGVSEHLELPYDYDVNTPIKVGLDYGFPALVAYVLLFVLGHKSPIQAAILVPILVMCFVTGAYQQFPPILFLLLLLISVARLRPPRTGSRLSA